MTEKWFSDAIIGMALLIPAWLAVSFFKYNFQINSDIFIVWYFPGVAIAAALFGRTPLTGLMPSWNLALAILLIGLTIGGAANIFVFRAVAGAPNSGLALAIYQTSNIGVYLFGAGLAYLVPKYFKQAAIDPWSLVGIILAIAGVSIIAWRQSKL